MLENKKVNEIKPDENSENIENQTEKNIIEVSGEEVKSDSNDKNLDEIQEEKLVDLAPNLEEQVYKSFKSKDEFQKYMDDHTKSLKQKISETKKELEDLKAKNKELGDKVTKAKFSTKFIFINKPTVETKKPKEQGAA